MTTVASASHIEDRTVSSEGLSLSTGGAKGDTGTALARTARPTSHVHRGPRATRIDMTLALTTRDAAAGRSSGYNEATASSMRV